MSNLLDKLNLNKAQKEAVLEISKPLFVVAGAGTGKTLTLTSKVAYLISIGVSPNNILTVTFTNKAAEEMRNRIEEILGYPIRTPWISTFHSFTVKVLRGFIEDLGLSFNNNFVIIDDDELVKIVKALVKENNLNKELSNKKTAIKLYEVKSFMEMNETRSFPTDIDYILNDELETLYYALEKYMEKNNLLYFDDLQILTRRLFKNFPEIRKHYSDRFDYILVDEFQDTDVFQFEILKYLRETKKEIFVVGDPDQSIYSFRGARYENNQQFIKHFNAKVVTLDENYRSTNKILRCANNLISHNFNRTSPKNLHSSLGEGENVVYKDFYNDYNEVKFILEKVQDLVRRGVSPYKIAILYRRNSLSMLIEKELLNTNIPYTIYGGISFFIRKEVKDIMSYLYLMSFGINIIHFDRVINVPTRGIGKVSQDKLTHQLEKTGILESILNADVSDKVRTSAKDFIKSIKIGSQKIEQLEDLTDIIEYILADIGYREYLKDNYPEDYPDRLSNIGEIKNLIRGVQNLNKDLSNLEIIKKVIDDISLMSSRNKNEEKENTIILSTVHQVKGLEFDAVFMYGLNHTIFPNYVQGGISDEEEERRIFYVGLTRAKNHLYLTSSKIRYINGRRPELLPSPFINEALPHLNKNKHKKDLLFDTKTIIPKNDIVSFQEGDQIVHTLFGPGIIMKVGPDFGVIKFDKFPQEKRLVLDSKYLTKTNKPN